jgi:hypothetical protein
MVKKREKDIAVSLPELDLQRITIKLVGTSPLVTHPFSKKAIAAIEDKQHGKAKNSKHEARNEWQEIIECCYWISEPPSEFTEEAWESALANGARFGFQAGGLKNCAVSAAYRRGLVPNMPTARGLFAIENTFVDYLYGKQVVEILYNTPPKMRRDCLSTFNSGADMRYRPQFDDWSMNLSLVYDNSVITRDILINWFKLGGFSVGIGEARAEKCADNWGSFTLAEAKSNV